MSEENKSLLKIIEGFENLEQRLIESGGELTPEMQEQIDLNSGDLKRKIDNYYYWFKHVEAKSEHIKSLEKELYSARKALENGRDRLKDYLKHIMISQDKKEFQGNEFRFTLSEPKDKLVIEFSDHIPVEYTKEVMSFEPDKEKITKALCEGKKVDGARLEITATLRSSINTGERKLKGKKDDDDTKK